MTPAQRLLAAPVITSDLLEEVLECSTSDAIGIVVHMTTIGALEYLGEGDYRLTDNAREAMESNAAHSEVQS